jgi:diguanylate cyclase (GGDEF)-like protein/PAS domain S-box-containing protein
VRGEWDVVVLGPHFAAALLARDLGDTGPDLQRTFEYALTYDRDTVIRAAQALLIRVAPRLPAPALETLRAELGDVAPSAPPAVLPAASPAGEALLHRALAATTSGVTIADLTRPDQPLVYVNGAFEALAGFPGDQLLGRNCRFLQGSDTDPAAVDRIRAAVHDGQECRQTLLQYRGTERTPWWNEVFLAPVTDPSGQVVQYIGVQNDVTARVEAEQALLRERDRAQSYLARIEEFAFTDPLTGLANRRRLEERVETALLNACITDSALALLYLDLDGFKAINDELGHAAGDQVLVQTAHRLKSRLRRSDVLARLGGDEFLVAVLGLDPSTAAAEAVALARELEQSLGRPVLVDGREVHVQVSLGVSAYPEDGDSFGALLHAADTRMYDAKHPHRRR